MYRIEKEKLNELYISLKLSLSISLSKTFSALPSSTSQSLPISSSSCSKLFPSLLGLSCLVEGRGILGLILLGVCEETL